MPNAVRFPATHKFYWPGEQVSYICLGHLPTLKNIAAAISLHVEIEPLAEEDLQLCGQKSSCPFPPEEGKADE